MVNDDFSQAHVLGLDFGTLSVRAAAPLLPSPLLMERFF